MRLVVNLILICFYNISCSFGDPAADNLKRCTEPEQMNCYRYVNVKDYQDSDEINSYSVIESAEEKSSANSFRKFGAWKVDVRLFEEIINDFTPLERGPLPYLIPFRRKKPNGRKKIARITPATARDRIPNENDTQIMESDSTNKTIAQPHVSTIDIRCPHPLNSSAAPVYFYTTHGNCYEYSKCTELGVEVALCPEGENFNLELNKCQEIRTARCRQNYRRLFFQYVCRASSLTRMRYLPHLEDCSSYYQCEGNNLVQYDCPINLLWNINTSRCDYEENVIC